MMNHRRQSVHNRDVCIQLYSGICRPFIISGQSLQKHSRPNIRLSLPPPSLAPILPLSALHSPDPSVPPPFFLSSQTSSFFSFHSSTRHLLFPPLTPSTLLVHPSPPTVCLRVENTIIYSFVSPSFPLQSIYTGKYQVASRKEVLVYMVSDL